MWIFFFKLKKFGEDSGISILAGPGLRSFIDSQQAKIISHQEGYCDHHYFEIPFEQMDGPIPHYQQYDYYLYCGKYSFQIVLRKSETAVWYRAVHLPVAVSLQQGLPFRRETSRANGELWAEVR